MKLQYYLRGLGIGMAVTALILGISFSDRQELAAQTLTDDQIRERAAELGMVDSSELTLAALQNSMAQPTGNTTAEPEETSAPEATAEPEITPAPEATQVSEATVEPETTPVPEPTAEPESTQVPETITASEPAQTVSITINRGADSGSVSEQLYEAGLVEDAKKFDNYLCNNGYSRSISDGTYEIAPGTSEEEIAKIITGKR